MVKEHGSVIIRRPVEEVFAYVSDLTHSAAWQTQLLEARKLTDGPVGVGTRYAFVRQFMGRKIEAANEFVAYEPNRKVQFRIASGPTSLPDPAAPMSALLALTGLMLLAVAGFVGLRSVSRR